MIDNEFYCKELFVVKHKSNYSCESSIYFNLTTDIIRNTCNFNFDYNKTDVTPTVLDGGDEIILANWQMINVLYVTLTMTFQSKFQTTPMFR